MPERREDLMDFQDSVAFVTGGTGALGSAVVLDLLTSGARVAAPYTVETEWHHLESRASETGAPSRSLRGIPVDLTEAEEVGTAVRSVHEAFGRIDFLLALAGGFAWGKSYETSEAAWHRMMDLNLKTLVSVLGPVIRVMLKQKSGRVITVASGALLSGPGAGIAAYAVSKGAVRQLTEILAEEVQDYNIRVHCLLPGTMDTPANRRALPDADPARWVKTGEVARVVHRLLLEEAATPVLVPVLQGPPAPPL
jgi:NAD(P)-dependent dehydrogenase (short-subunit alcohol dehydrogenase family)